MGGILAHTDADVVTRRAARRLNADGRGATDGRGVIRGAALGSERSFVYLRKCCTHNKRWKILNATMTEDAFALETV